MSGLECHEGKGEFPEMADCKNKKRRRQQQRKCVSRIHAREPRMPEIAPAHRCPRVGVNQDEAGEDKEETHADVTDRRYIVKPCRSKHGSHSQRVKQQHVKCGKEAQRSKRRQTRPGMFGVHGEVYARVLLGSSADCMTATWRTPAEACSSPEAGQYDRLNAVFAGS